MLVRWFKGNAANAGFDNRGRVTTLQGELWCIGWLGHRMALHV